MPGEVTMGMCSKRCVCGTRKWRRLTLFIDFFGFSDLAPFLPARPRESPISIRDFQRFRCRSIYSSIAVTFWNVFLPLLSECFWRHTVHSGAFSFELIVSLFDMTLRLKWYWDWLIIEPIQLENRVNISVDDMKLSKIHDKSLTKIRKCREVDNIISSNPNNESNMYLLISDRVCCWRKSPFIIHHAATRVVYDEWEFSVVWASFNHRTYAAHNCPTIWMEK